MLAKLMYHVDGHQNVHTGMKTKGCFIHKRVNPKFQIELLMTFSILYTKYNLNVLQGNPSCFSTCVAMLKSSKNLLYTLLLTYV